MSRWSRFKYRSKKPGFGLVSLSDWCFLPLDGSGVSAHCFTEKLADNIQVMTRLDFGKAAPVFHDQKGLDNLGGGLATHIGKGLSNETTPEDIQVFVAGVGMQEPGIALLSEPTFVSVVLREQDGGHLAVVAFSPNSYLIQEANSFPIQL